ncbi:DinB family protein [Pseudonocardia sp.]|uniref:DinB family protein n=1 Tax=Pseudonocardia sp. TaxID=60912 RepID=UPI002B4B2158|nr:DinB family protein [Pseudonocardia sp.]
MTWHIGWWWSVALDHAQGRAPRERDAVAWPGPEAAVGWLRGLHDEWAAVLDRLTDADLAAPAPFPWPADAGMTVAQMLGWANAELMKNVTELGQLRLLRAAH